MLEAQTANGCLDSANFAITQVIRRYDVPTFQVRKNRHYRDAYYTASSYVMNDILYMSFDRFGFVIRSTIEPVPGSGGFPFYGTKYSSHFKYAFKEALAHAVSDMLPINITEGQQIRVMICSCWKWIEYSYPVYKVENNDTVLNYYAACTELQQCSDNSSCCIMDYYISSYDAPPDDFTHQDTVINVSSMVIDSRCSLPHPPITCTEPLSQKCIDICSLEDVQFDYFEMIKLHYTKRNDPKHMYNGSIEYDPFHETPFHLRQNVESIEVVDGAIQVSPNPTEEQASLSINSEKTGILRAKVFNITGTQILELKEEKTGYKFNSPIDLSGYPAGIYFLSVYLNDEFLGCEKIIKE